MFNHGADPNIADNQKRTLLMLLALQSPSSLVHERIEYLIDHFSPNPNVQDIHGLTVMHHISSVKLSKENQEKLIPTVKLLTSAGVDVNTKDFASRTAIFQATKAENIPLMDFLISKGCGRNKIRSISTKFYWIDFMINALTKKAFHA